MPMKLTPKILMINRINIQVRLAMYQIANQKIVYSLDPSSMIESFGTGGLTEV